MVKTITIDDKAYKLLSSQKRVNESFSKVIHRVCTNGKGADDLFGVLKDVPVLSYTELKKQRVKEEKARMKKLWGNKEVL